MAKLNSTLIRNALRKEGYNEDQILEMIAGFLAIARVCADIKLEREAGLTEH